MPVGMVALINKSLAQFAHWANKEQIAKRKEQLILRRVIPAQAGIHCVLRTL